MKASWRRKVGRMQPKPGGLIAFGTQTQDLRVTAVIREAGERERERERARDFIFCLNARSVIIQSLNCTVTAQLDHI